MCKIYLNKYDEAQEMFNVATKLNVELIPEEKQYYFPWHAVATWVFSGNFSIANYIWKILDHYREHDYAPYAPLAKYSYIVTELLAPRGEIIDGWINDLINYEKKKLKDIYSEGYCFKAIREKNLLLFHENLSILLAKHQISFGLAHSVKLQKDFIVWKAWFFVIVHRHMVWIYKWITNIFLWITYASFKNL